jgi:hypothetical protein
VTESFPRLHCLVVGPGLGRSSAAVSAVTDIVQEAVWTEKP